MSLLFFLVASASRAAVTLPSGFRQAVAERFAVWPADFGPLPETLARPAPSPTPPFWDADWDQLNQAFAKQAYVVLTLAQDEGGVLLDREEDHLLELLAEINWRAQRWGATELAAGDEALRHVVTGGLDAAVATLGRPVDPRRLAHVLNRLRTRTASLRDLAEAAGRLRVEWRRTDGEAQVYRGIQLAAVWFLSAMVGRYSDVITPTEVTELAVGLTVFWFSDLARTYLPLGWRFWPRLNRVGRHVGDCAAEL